MAKTVKHAIEGVEILHEVVAIETLAAHPRNYRRHPQEQIDRLRASLKRFGQVRSIVVQRGVDAFLMVAGHGVVEAAREEGYTTLRADVIPATWTQEQIEGYLIADNEHARNADDDQLLLAQMLQEQADAGADILSLGYSTDELDALLQELGDASVGSEPPVFKDYDESVEDDLPTEMCTQCGKLCLKNKS
jgi:ParB-like chromosome segregation protein Spo0J